MANERNVTEAILKAILTANAQQKTAALAALESRPAEPIRPVETGPLLLSGAAAAKRLGVCKNTFWRLLHEGRIRRVEVSPGCFRVPRTDLDDFAAGRGPGCRPPLPPSRSPRPQPKATLDEA